MHTKIILQFVVFFFWIFDSESAKPAILGQPDFYAQGIAQRESGNWQAALDFWLIAQDSLTQKNNPDPRIGIAFIELATEKEATDYFANASEIYLWGLSGENVDVFKEEIEAEINRISPLLTEEQFSNWLKLLENGDPRLNHELKAFWVIKDPIPTTEKNERLIEHWQRIAYARENFKNENTNIYGTDDRGLVYVKYGEPNKKLAGKLGTDQMEIMRWFPNDFLLRQEIQRFNNTPEVEIWVYGGLSKDETTVFLFGKKSGFGKYGLRYGVEDFIPNRAFRRSSTRTTQNVLPGAFLQLMYYGELMTADSFFLERFRELEALWSNSRAAGQLSPNRDVLLGLLNHYKNIDQDNAKFKYLVLDITHAFEGLELLDLKYKTFRYFDQEHEPRMSVMAVSSDQSFNDDFSVSFFKEEKKSKYKHRHTLVAYDQNWDPKTKSMEYPALRATNTSIFNLSGNELDSHYKLVAEKVLLDVRRSKLEESDLPDTAKVIGIASVFLEKRAALNPDTTLLEATDLIVGVDTPQEVKKTLGYPFPIIPRDPIKKTTPLQIYLQLYHLLPASDQKVKFRLECKLYRFKDEPKKDKKKKTISKNFDFEEFVTNSEKVFELDVQKVEPGDYELEVKIIDKNSKQKVIRKALFRIAG